MTIEFNCNCVAINPGSCGAALLKVIVGSPTWESVGHELLFACPSLPLEAAGFSCPSTLNTCGYDSPSGQR